ncbi:MAG: Glu-tRNA(Gln) amidotransferase GatDE subunit E [Thermoproteota archaeon]|nr:MAG: Glu-tRNA(Gln) amidotransferase GatDE subunit E [Candidatus Korarchaeota archaeon]
MNYEGLGLTVGIEIHQRLNTRKLFCRCPSILRRDKPQYTVKRRLRVSMSELGEIDPAAEFENLRNRIFVYQGYYDTTCEVEIDESPPLDMNTEALRVAIQVALMLNMSVVDEIHTMRKVVIDGSNTTGFQRTALVAVGNENSVIKTKWGDVRISTLCLEEESAYIVESTPGMAVYKIDRLGIPLIEIATAPDIHHPEQCRDVAFKLGRLLRATGKVQRGIGTIRQDINISIKGGARQEIKGVQELSLLPLIIKREIERQLNLLKIRDELNRRLNVGEFDTYYTDVTDIFKDSKSKIVSRSLKRGLKAYCIPTPGFKGILSWELQPGRRFGTEIADIVRTVGVKGIIHSDELPGYGISNDDVRLVEERVGVPRDEGAFILIFMKEEKADSVFKLVRERLEYAFKGIPSETRQALPDGNTKYMRPIPGAARMYPETDIPPISIESLVEEISNVKFEYPEDIIGKIIEFGLNRELAEQIFDNGQHHIFFKIVKETGAKPTLVGSTLVQTMKYLSREGLNVENISDKHLVEIFKAVSEGIIGKEAVPNLLVTVAENPKVNIRRYAEQLKITEGELENIIRRIIRENYEKISQMEFKKAFNTLMGLVMKEVRGRIDGKVVHDYVHSTLKELYTS